MTRGAHTDQMFELVRLHVAVEASVGNLVVDMETLPHLLFRNAALLTTTLIAVTGLPGLDLPIPPRQRRARFLGPKPPSLTTGGIAELQAMPSAGAAS